jgi:peptide deformylase
VSILEVLVWPHPVLETPAQPVTKFDAALAKFVADMHETMHASGGIGLAANQVGDLRRIIAIEIAWSQEQGADEKKEWWHNQKFTIINPVIVGKEGKIKWQEGCLSFPEVYDFVDRAAEIWIKYQDESGKELELHANGLFAVCLQHEIDHLDGIVFFKRMSRLKADFVRKKMLRRGTVNAIQKEPV